MYPKPATTTRHRRLVVLPVVLLVALSVAIGALVAAFAPSPSSGGDGAAALARVDRGLIDLRGHDFAQTPVLALNGQWSGCAQRLVDPREYAAGLRPACDQALAVPGRWRERLLPDPAAEDSGGARHFATLHLRLQLPQTDSPLVLRLVGMYPANRVWVDGRLAAQTGQVATHVGDEIGNLSLQIVALPGGAGPVELVIQASNFSQIAAGAMNAEIGLADVIDAQQTRNWALAMVSVGVLLLMGGYHLALYFLRRSEVAPLYLGLNCLLLVGTVLCMATSEWAIRVLIPNAPGDVLYRIWPFCLFLSSAFAYQFYRALYPQEFPRWIARALWVVSLGCALVAVAAPLRVLAAILPVYALVIVARLAYSAWALAQAARRRRPGAAIILGGYLVMLALMINDLLNWTGVLHTQLTIHLGLIVHMFSQSLALALRFSTLHATVEQLSTALESRNRALGEQITERIRLQHEIVSVSEEERRRMSHELHDGLCQQLTAARLQCSGVSGLWPASAAGKDELDRLSMLLEQSVDHAYDLSHGLWPMDPGCGDAGAALSALVARQRETTTIAIDFRQLNACAHCAANHTAQLYGIAREAINNAVKHAQPSRIAVTLDCSPASTITLTIADDGQPESPVKASRGGLGRRIMVYRAQMAGGEFAVETPPAGGTRVRCTLPCARGESA